MRLRELGFCQTAVKLFLCKYVYILLHVNVVWEVYISQVLKTSGKSPSAIAEILEHGYCPPQNRSLAVGKSKWLLCWLVCASIGFYTYFSQIPLVWRKNIPKPEKAQNLCIFIACFCICLFPWFSVLRLPYFFFSLPTFLFPFLIH